jgi:hypothetical protein
MLHIVAQNTYSKQAFVEGDSYLFSYHLTKGYAFSEPHYARLSYFGGVLGTCHVFADFVQLQEVNGTQERFLGCNAVASKRSWVPLENNNINSSGLIKFRFAEGAKIDPKKKVYCVIQIASESWIRQSALT